MLIGHSRIALCGCTIAVRDDSGTFVQRHANIRCFIHNHTFDVEGPCRRVTTSGENLYPAQCIVNGGGQFRTSGGKTG